MVVCSEGCCGHLSLRRKAKQKLRQEFKTNNEQNNNGVLSMTWLHIILMVMIGLIGAANVLSGPSIKNAIRTLRPYQGIIGVVALVIGILWLLNLLSWNANVYIVWWIGAGVMMALGLLLGIDLIQSVFNAGFINDIAGFLRPFKAGLGVAALVVAVIGILARLGIMV